MLTETSKVLTLVFTDLADSTGLKTAHGDRAIGELITRHREHVHELAVRHAGRIIDWAGDGCFLTFETSSAAVEFGLRLQQVHHYESDLPGVRVGIHWGEVTEKPFDGTVRVEGLIVDLSARIAGLAAPGQVLVSGPVQQSAKQRLGIHEFGQPIRWENYGLHRLKGFDESVDIREAGLENISPFTPPQPSEKAWPEGMDPNAEAGAGGKPIRKIAVLPFTNLSGATDQEWFVDGMTETLIAELARIKALTIISRTSVMFYKNANKPLPEIAQELNVDAIVEGSVLRSGDRVRITAQLIEAEGDTHLWADRYDGTMEEVLDLQSDVALAIAKEVNVALAPDEVATEKASRPVKAEAFEALLKARHAAHLMTAKGYEDALAFIDEALMIDPSYAEAYATLAFTHVRYVTYGSVRPREIYFDAQMAVREAVRLGGDSPTLHGAMATIARIFEWDWDRSVACSQRAIELNPSDSEARSSHGVVQVYRGERDDAFKNIELAIELDPLNPLAYLGRNFYYMTAGQPEEALSHCIDAYRRFPTATLGGVLASAYMNAGRLDEAIQLFEEIIAEFDRQPMFVSFLGYSYTCAGAPEKAIALLEELHARTTNEAVEEFYFGFIEFGLGRLDEAYPRFETAYRERTFIFMWSYLVRLYDCAPVKPDDRFERLFARLSLK